MMWVVQVLWVIMKSCLELEVGWTGAEFQALKVMVVMVVGVVLAMVLGGMIVVVLVVILKGRLE